jgi:methionine synthase I (cobalamin-dependent)
MAQNFIERLKQSPVLCDGAMGTLLYAKGIFINRCYDELNSVAAGTDPRRPSRLSAGGRGDC